MVGITEISAIVAAAGVLVGVAYYILTIRHQTRIRQTDLIIRLYSFTASKENLDAYQKIMDREIKGYDDYKKKYGGFTEFNQVSQSFQEVGMLLKRRLIDTELIEDMMGRREILEAYEKLKPLREDIKKKLGIEHDSFDYLYNEMKKREEAGVKNG